VGKLKKKQDGFTVVELMIALALLLIILATGYMFFGFGFRSFNRGEQRAIAQQSIRTAAAFISSEIRYANLITINPETVSTSDDFNYIYLNGDSVYYQDKDKSIPPKTLLDGTVDQMSYSIIFMEDSYVVASSKVTLVLAFNLAADSIYSLDTNVFILNLEDSSNYNDLSAQTGNVTGIKYQKPFD